MLRRFDRKEVELAEVEVEVETLHLLVSDQAIS
jgi:hypothetical protein